MNTSHNEHFLEGPDGVHLTEVLLYLFIVDVSINLSDHYQETQPYSFSKEQTRTNKNEIV
jgi:hypothetical protein